MTIYTLMGTIKDSEGNDVVVGESSASLQRFQSDCAYYTNKANGFTGVLTTVRFFDNNETMRSYIQLG